MALLPRNGEIVVLILGSLWGMIINKEDHIHHKILNIQLNHMGTILPKDQEATLVLVGNKGPQRLCMASRHRRITTMGSHRVQNMGSLPLIPRHLHRAMGKDTMK